jgi:exodeoxyribonuclease V beta subunit
MTGELPKTFDLRGPMPEGITLLEASAGTGKTYTIANLFLRLVVEENHGVEEILVVTYTKAAAAELSDRIRCRLRDAVRAFDGARRGTTEVKDDVLAHLIAKGQDADCIMRWRERAKRALEGFDEATLSTIHGFCQQSLRQNAFESRAPFDTELVGDMSALLDELVRDFWSFALHRAPAPMLAWLAAHEINLQALMGLAKAVTNDPDLVVVPQPSDPTTEIRWPGVRAWDELVDQLRDQWQADRDDLLTTLCGALRSDPSTPADETLTERTALMRRHAEAVDRWLVEETSPGIIPRATAWFGAERLSQQSVFAGLEFPALCTTIDALSSACDVPEEALSEAALRLKHQLVHWVRETLTERKRRHRHQSFDDLLRQLRDGLREPETGESLVQAIRQRFRAALIDEFQDTDPVQWEIFHRIFGQGHGRLVLVGDPKQAIYGFRGADVYTYLQARDQATEAFTLNTNHRSDARFVQALNHLFGRAQVESPFLHPSIQYQQVEAKHQDDRIRFKDGSKPSIRVSFVRREATEVTIHRGTISTYQGNRTIPSRVAAQVATMLNEGAEIEVDDATFRPVGPGDMAILVRSNKQAKEMREALARVGVPAVLSGAESVLSTPEAMELSRVLAGIAEPNHAGRLRGALATEILGVGGPQLAAMEDDPAELERWLVDLQRWRTLWETQGFIQMFHTLAQDTNLIARTLERAGGERRVTNILHLAELIHSAAVRQDLRPAGVLTWIVQEQEAPSDEEDARLLRLENDADAVQLVTIHRSKGLQYPIVWCPYLWTPPFKIYPGSIRFHDANHGDRLTLDVGVGAADTERQGHFNAAKLESRAELLRLAYVAITRARHQCILYWGAFGTDGCSPLDHLFARDDVQLAKVTDEQLLTHLHAIADGSEGTLGIEIAPPPGLLAHYDSHTGDAAELRARAWNRSEPLDRLWRRGSFSALTRAAHDTGPSDDARDHDATPQGLGASLEMQALDEAARIAADDTRQVTLADFPRGARPGTFLHQVLEEVDFQAPNPNELNQHIRHHLRGYGFDPERWTETVQAGLEEVLQTPFWPGDDAPRLADLSRRDRLDELDFDLAVRSADAIHAQDLAAAFEAHGSDAIPADYPERVAALGFAPLRGFLTGIVDLIFRWRPPESDAPHRWFLVDYKSNHLGDHPLGYRPERLAEAMAERHYILQYHLYLVGLHRFLQWRLPQYDYDTHIGQVAYLFLRGMSPEHPEDLGVFRDRPSLAMVEALSALFREDPP